MIGPVLVRPAVVADIAELAEVAATTFPLACPDSVPDDDVAAFVATHLSPQRFSDYLAEPDRIVLVACAGDRIAGYTMAVREDDTVELSKMYVLAEHHRSGAAAGLMDAAIAWARDRGAATIWLGVNERNERAQRFYRKSGFTVTGTRTFTLGASVENDFVMRRNL